jgi:hypothetical protein
MYTAMREHEQQGEANRESGIAGGENITPLVAVGSVAREREQQNRRKKWRQADEAEIEGPMSNLVDLPPDGHGLHFDRGHDQEAGDLEQHERGMGEGGASSSGVGGCGHELLM